MKINKILPCLFLFVALYARAQPNTEVYLFDLSSEMTLSNPKNISNNDGYDNQPSFIADNTIVFAATRDGQTDIKFIDISNGSTSKWVTDTPTGSEYSPLKIPNKNAVSAIRLDLDGLQRLYYYDLNTGASEVLVPDLKIGYHVWLDKENIVATVLKENQMDLVHINLKTKKNTTIYKNVGRSLLKIPNTNHISFIAKNETLYTIKSYNPVDASIKKIAPTYKNSEDICWLANGFILTGSEKSIFKFDSTKSETWEQLWDFNKDEINNISRIAVNNANTRIAFVSDESPTVLIDKQLAAYNNRDIIAFMATFSQDIKLYNYPNELFSTGHKELKAVYEGFFESTPDLNCEIKKRIVLNNKIIDKEYITANGKNFSAVAIYEVENGLISKVTFIR